MKTIDCNYTIKIGVGGKAFKCRIVPNEQIKVSVKCVEKPEVDTVHTSDNIEDNLIDLIGSTRQVSWAQSIRRNAVSRLLRVLEQAENVDQYLINQAVKSIVSELDTAGWWIDNKANALNTLLNMVSAYYTMSITSMQYVKLIDSVMPSKQG